MTSRRRFARAASPIALLIGLGLGAAAAAAAGPLATPPSPSTVTEANITRLTADILEHSQFAHHPFDNQLAGALLDRYLDALDGSRSLFLQSDVEELAAYRTGLAEATRSSGDARAAQAIFQRYLQRLTERTEDVGVALRTASFDFTGHDAYSFDREHAQRPRDLAAARQLWRQQLRAEYLQEKLGDKRPAQIATTLIHRHAQELRTMKAFKRDEVLEIYLDTLAHVYDPHSDYLGHEEMENLSISMNLSLFGIGASLESVDGGCKIRELIAGGPAARSGLLKPGDRITAVGQAGKEPVDIVNMPLTRAVELIRGPKGSTVTLTILPAEGGEAAAPKKVSLVRDRIKLEDQEAKARILDLPAGAGGAPLRLGVIDLPSFYADMEGHQGAGRRSATEDVARLLRKLKTENVRGLVLDLRRNGGGSLDEAISLTGLFIRKGPVVQTRDRAGHIEVGADTDPAVLYDGPMIVLVSRFSASASEILTGALQDYGRAIVVGDSSTFGKGTVQEILPLARVMDQFHLAHAYDPGALKFTTSKFYRPSGASTQLRGVASDIVIPSTSDFNDVSESSLKDPLPWDTVPAAPHDALNRVQPYLRTLRDRSGQRIAGEKAFAFLADDIARLKKIWTGKTVSLNEAERRAELARDKARQKERERQAKLLEAGMPVTYAITLQNSATPGLPPRVSPAAMAPAGEPADAADPEDLGSGRSSADDLVLREGVQILADYVGLLGGHEPPAHMTKAGQASPPS